MTLSRQIGLLAFGLSSSAKGFLVCGIQDKYFFELFLEDAGDLEGKDGGRHVFVAFDRVDRLAGNLDAFRQFGLRNIQNGSFYADSILHLGSFSAFKIYGQVKLDDKQDEGGANIVCHYF